MLSSYLQSAGIHVETSTAHEENEEGDSKRNNHNVASCSSCRRHAKLVNLHSSQPLVIKPPQLESTSV
jgi:hypothetical protein